MQSDIQLRRETVVHIQLCHPSWLEFKICSDIYYVYIYNLINSVVASSLLCTHDQHGVGLRYSVGPIKYLLMHEAHTAIDCVPLSIPPFTGNPQPCSHFIPANVSQKVTGGWEGWPVELQPNSGPNENHEREILHTILWSHFVWQRRQLVVVAVASLCYGVYVVCRGAFGSILKGHNHIAAAPMIMPFNGAHRVCPREQHLQLQN